MLPSTRTVKGLLFLEEFIADKAIVLQVKSINGLRRPMKKNWIFKTPSTEMKW